MANDLPPVPKELQKLGQAAQGFLEKLRAILTNSNSLSWALLDFAGSSLSDIQSRSHALLTNILGADESSSEATKNKHVSNAQLKALYDFIQNENLADFAALAGAANKLPYFSAANTMALADLTSAARARLASDFYHYYESDFIAASVNQGPFVGTAVNTGTVSFSGNNSEHPGYAIIRSSASPNSGHRYSTATAPFRIGGSEQFDCCFIIDTLTDCTIRMGFLDTVDQNDADDGFYIEIPPTGNAVGKTADATTRSTSATIATLTTGTWYHARVTMNSAMTLATFEIFDTAGTLLGSQTLSTNIPAATRNFGCALVATESVGVTADILRLDYMGFGFRRKLQRGNF